MPHAMNHLPKWSAGHIMTDRVPVVPPTLTIGEAKTQLQQHMSSYASINYLYVVEEAQLIGIVSIKELFRQPNQLRLGKIMRTNVVTVRPHTHQERVVYLALKNNIKAMPVVDDNNHWRGVVTNDWLMSVMNEEMQSDLLHLIGIHHAKATFDNIQTMSLWVALRHRLPWLLLGVLGGLVAAGIISAFEETLAKNVVLAAFIPLVVYIADAVGTQMEAFIIRDLATHSSIQFLKYLIKQLRVVLWIGIISSVVVFGISWLVYGDAHISLVVALTLTAAVLSSVCTGLLIPYIFSRLKFDPANASGPIATIIQDILSIVIYFAIASALL